MAETNTSLVTSILCSGRWTWSPDNRCTVKFNEDGTGELVCGVELNIFIASEFDWEVQSTTGDIDLKEPATIEVDMTLTKREFKKKPPPIDHKSLNDDAFRLKKYNVRLEKGNFKVEKRTTYGANPTYEFRMLWDKSPFPPLEEWARRRAASAGRYWERKDFYKDVIRNAN